MAHATEIRTSIHATLNLGDYQSLKIEVGEASELTDSDNYEAERQAQEQRLKERLVWWLQPKITDAVATLTRRLQEKGIKPAEINELVKGLRFFDVVQVLGGEDADS